MANFINIAKMLGWLLPLFLLCKRLEKLNLDKPKRVKQFPMPIVGLIYIGILMGYMRKIRQALITLIMLIPKLILAIGSFLGSDFTSVAATVLSFLNRINWEIWIAFLINILAMELYIRFKQIVLKIIDKRVSPTNKIVAFFAERIYPFDKERGFWFLKTNYIEVRRLFKVSYYGVIVIGFITMMITKNMVEAQSLTDLFYPVYPIILVGEFYFYLNGITKEEYLINVYGADEREKVVNYSIMRKFLRKVFGDRIINEETCITTDINSIVSNDELIRKYEKSEDVRERNLGKFYRFQLNHGLEFDQNYFQSSIELLKGKSILFNNPFYKDLIPYIFYPMHMNLLKNKKVLVVLGRHGIEGEIEDWLKSGIKSVTNLPYFWNIGILNKDKFDGDIGIITRSSVTDIELIQNNEEFFYDTSYVVIIEPSKLITTAQVGLNVIVKKCREIDKNNKITYCLMDKNADGLVDSMSHILFTSIGEVSATNKHKGTVSHMLWDTDTNYIHHRMVPNIARYLGFGTELSFGALKNQVSKAYWYGGEAFPVNDMKWIAKQYYHDLSKYANLPSNQGLIDSMFVTSQGYWNAQIEKDTYITVEDEAYNLFEVLRNFSTRSTRQGFINVITPGYLLRDYMARNSSIFITDPKAIPNMVADYSKTNRNVALSNILLMSKSKVNEEDLIEELSLIGIKTYDLKKQLWYEIYRCFTSEKDLKDLPKEYRECVAYTSDKKLSKDGYEFSMDVILSEFKYNFFKGKDEKQYWIEDEDFINCFAKDLKSAAYIAEDEQEKGNYLGTELISQVYQKYVPGQFLTLAGKYYEMHKVTANDEIVVRRASEYIDNRVDYRQIRHYKINYAVKSSSAVETQKINKIVVESLYSDFSVRTNGYFKSYKYNDFKNADLVKYDNDSDTIPERKYINKRILRIEVPYEECNDEVRYTLTLLINEVFRTLFSENQGYIVAVTHYENIDERNPLTYTISGDGKFFDKKSIYIIEDSQLDLGLLEIVERNLERILNIISDYLVWHFNEVELSLNPPEKEEFDSLDNDVEDETEIKEKKENFIVRFFKKLFKKKDKKPKTNDNPIEQDGTPAENNDVVTPEEPDSLKLDEEAVEPEKIEDASKEPDENKVIASDVIKDNKGEAEGGNTSELNCEVLTGQKPLDDNKEDEASKPQDIIVKEEAKETKYVRKPYHESYYTLYGYDVEPNYIHLKEALDYLTLNNFDKNGLRTARENRKALEKLAQEFVPNKPNSRYCSFCGCEIIGAEYDRLSDGRLSCTLCSRTALKDEKEYLEIFEEVRRNLESLFGLTIASDITIEVGAKGKIEHKAKKSKSALNMASDNRIKSKVDKSKNVYNISIESGAPRMQTILQMVYELIHIWEDINWNRTNIFKTYGKHANEIYDGASMWALIQYAYLIGEPVIAKREERMLMFEDGTKKRGYLKFKDNYPISEGTILNGITPFYNHEMPLSLDYLKDKEKERDDEE